VEDAEQRDGLGSEAAREPVAVEAETERDAAHDRLAERRERGHVLEHLAPQAGRRRREQIRAVQGSSGAHTRVVGRELGPEVDAFLAIGSPRRQLAADGEPAPPGRPPPIAMAAFSASGAKKCVPRQAGGAARRRHRGRS
jgi:hypothetical protein